MSKDVPLAIDAARLPDDPVILKALIVQLLDGLRKQDARVKDLEHRMDLLLRRLYGRSSEKLDPAQLPLFDTTPEEPIPQLPPSAPRPPSTTGVAKKPGHGRRQLPDRLKRVEVIHDLTPAEKELLGGEANLVSIGREVTEQLEWEPSSLYVIQHVQLTYARREPAATDGQPTILTAAKPPQPIPGGLPGPGLMAHVATAKYVDHQPLNRQQRQFARHGLELPRQTTCDWALAGAELLLPLDFSARVLATLRSMFPRPTAVLSVVLSQFPRMAATCSLLQRQAFLASDALRPQKSPRLAPSPETGAR